MAMGVIFNLGDRVSMEALRPVDTFLPVNDFS